MKKEIESASEAPLVLLEGFPKNQAELESFNQQVRRAATVNSHQNPCPVARSVAQMAKFALRANIS